MRSPDSSPPAEGSPPGDPGRGDDGWVEVYHGDGAGAWLEAALVLTALGIEHRMTRTEAFGLQVPPAAAERARRELEEYAAETVVPEPSAPPPDERPGARFVPGYALALLTLHLFERFHVFGLDWLEAGRTRAGAILAGQWWRTATALTLHADASHLLNNLLFGSFFGVLLARQVGCGRAWLGWLLSGAVGNGLNAWVRSPDHTSIGASTGVFGLLGLLVAVQWRQPAGTRRRLRRWAPPVVGAVCLGWLGTAGGRTDVPAHVAGALAGLALGLLLGKRRPLRTAGLAAAALALGLLAGAWWLAFH